MFWREASPHKDATVILLLHGQFPPTLYLLQPNESRRLSFALVLQRAETDFCLLILLPRLPYLFLSVPKLDSQALSPVQSHCEFHLKRVEESQDRSPTLPTFSAPFLLPLTPGPIFLP